MFIELSSVALLDGVLVHNKMLNKRLSKEQGELYATLVGVIFKVAGKPEALIPYSRVGAIEALHPDALTAHFLGVPTAQVTQAPPVDSKGNDSASAVAVVANLPSENKWGSRRK